MSEKRKRTKRKELRRKNAEKTEMKKNWNWQQKADFKRINHDLFSEKEIRNAQDVADLIGNEW